MEAMAIVLRAFRSDAVPDAAIRTDPARRPRPSSRRVTLADAEVFGRRAEKAAKEATADASKRLGAEAIAKAAALLGEGIPLRAGAWSEAQLDAFRDLAPLTLKPAVWVVNVGEDSGDPATIETAVRAVVPAGDVVVVVSAELEEEASRLDAADRAELYEGLGLGEGARLVRATYEPSG
jgi:ribosome-binding ATPase YchF (GTP1/OBG family)